MDSESGYRRNLLNHAVPVTGRPMKSPTKISNNTTRIVLKMSNVSIPALQITLSSRLSNVSKGCPTHAEPVSNLSLCSTPSWRMKIILGKRASCLTPLSRCSKPNCATCIIFSVHCLFWNLHFHQTHSDSAVCFLLSVFHSPLRDI